MINLLIALIYISFISLGLPDAVLGSAWPSISTEFGIPLSNMGIITIIIAAGTIISSLQSDRLIEKIGVRLITSLSVGMTAIALFGFSTSNSFVVLCLWAIPYGLGAGSVDAALNNYVAVNFESKHMSWLHCMWGVGATLGPVIMGRALAQGSGWNSGYTSLFIIQAVLTGILFISKPAWSAKTPKISNQDKAKNLSTKALSLKEIMSIAGVPQLMITFLCFCAIEQTTGLWASSYLVLNRNVSTELAASFAGLFYLGITIGRGISGFIAMKFTDTQMIRCGEALMILGIITLCLPLGKIPAFFGLILIGLGSAPVYPCIIHSTPTNFGVENSQSIIGVLMASAYTGTLIMPALFGVIAKITSINVYPIFLGALLLTMIVLYESVLSKIKNGEKK